MSETSARTGEAPPHRYGARLADEIERKWQDRWEADRTFWTPNPSGPLADGFERVADRQKLYVLDMFPYPSGAGLHVGHPLGYIGTDVYARFKRMTGHNVLHAMGYDAFGLPAEQYAVRPAAPPGHDRREHRHHAPPAARLGLGHDPRRSVATTDVALLPLDAVDLPAALQRLVRRPARPGPPDRRADRASSSPASAPTPDDTRVGRSSTAGSSESSSTRTGSRTSRRRSSTGAPRWAPCSPTRRSRPTAAASAATTPSTSARSKQWMLRITAYAERLLADLDLLDWPESIKLMQRNWIGRSEGADVVFSVEDHEDRRHRGVHHPARHAVRRDVHGARARAPAPRRDRPQRVAAQTTELPWQGTFGQDRFPPEAVARVPRVRGEQDRARAPGRGQAEDRRVHRRVRDQPGERRADPDLRRRLRARRLRHRGDHGRARARTSATWSSPRSSTSRSSAPSSRQPASTATRSSATGPRSTAASSTASTSPRPRRGSSSGSRSTSSARARSPTSCATGCSAASATGASRSRSSTTTTASRSRCRSRCCRSSCPRSSTSSPDPRRRRRDAAGAAARPRRDWVEVELDLGDGPAVYRRETNTMPQWAGSCWYYLRYLDPTNENRLVDPEVERYWMTGSAPSGGVDLYVGGAEHAVLHLLYARFWHKVLFDLGHVSTPEPFHRLFNQGTITAAEFTDERGIVRRGGRGRGARRPVPLRRRRGAPGHWGRMGKSRKNAVAPDEIYRDYGADTLRLYEMFMGPLDASRPWSTTDIVGVYRFLQRFWRNVVDEDTGELRVEATAADDETRRSCTARSRRCADDMDALQFNTAIARLFELNNRLTQVVAETGARAEAGRRADGADARAARARTSPRSSGSGSATTRRSRTSRSRTPTPRCSSTRRVEIPVQVNGKVRGAGRRSRRGRPTTSTRPRPAPTSGSPPLLERHDGAQGRRRARPPGQLRHRVVTSGPPTRLRSSAPRSSTFPTSTVSACRHRRRAACSRRGSRR